MKIKKYDHHFQEQNHNHDHDSYDYPDLYRDHQDAFPHHLLLWILSEDRHKGDRSSQFGKSLFKIMMVEVVVMIMMMLVMVVVMVVMMPVMVVSMIMMVM